MMDIKRLRQLSGIAPLNEAYKPKTEAEEKALAHKCGVEDATKGRPRANASDVYGPYGGDYNTGYNSVNKDKK
jgi:hypothetical protein